MISFSDWNALLLYADELEEKFAADHGTKIVIRPFNNAMYEKCMAISVLDYKGNEFDSPYITVPLTNLLDGKIIMAEAIEKIAKSLK